ncbi:MAG: ROK family protein [Eubacteriales bacterium]
MIRIDKIGANEKENNILSIIECIVNTDEISTNEIMGASKVSSATVSRGINFLKQKNLIVINGKGITECGRRPEIYSLNAVFGYVIHYEFCTGKISGCLADLSGTILSEVEAPIDLEPSIKILQTELISIRDQMILEAQISKDKILAAGISVPGVVDENYLHIERIPNIYNLQNINVLEGIKEALDLPVIINNVSKLATIGEKYTSYPDCKHMVFMNFTDSYGIGGGIIINGELYYGNRRSAGEIGDMFFNQTNFETEYHNNMGCLESYSGIQILYNRLNDAMGIGRARILQQLLDESGNKVLNLDIIEQAVVKQDYDVCEILDEITKIWSSAIINIFSLIDPEILVIGGAISSQNQTIINKIKFFVSKGLYRTPDIRASDLGYRAQVIGGIYLLKEFVYNKIIAKVVFD